MRASFLAPAALVVVAIVAVALLVNGDHGSTEGCVAPEDAACVHLPPGPCREIGATDLNPKDVAVTPRLGVRLLPLRADGRLPFGFNDLAYLAGQASAGEDAALHRGVGSTLWRVPLDWRSAEPRPGELDFTQADAMYCAGLSQGVQPIFTIAAAPAWASDQSVPCAADCIRPPSPEHYPDLRRFAELTAMRYPQAAAIEAWNEPNLHQFWGRPDPVNYTAVLREIYLGTKSGNPELPVLGGALSNNMTGDPVTGDRAIFEFLSTIYRSGAGGYMDALSVHTYPVYPLEDPRQELDRTLQGVHDLIDGLDAPGRRIWVTEVGVSTLRAPDGGSPAFTPDQQAQTLLEVYRRLELDADIDAVLFHTLIDPNARVQSAPGYGWVTPAEGMFQLKPVYCEFSSRFAVGNGCPASAPAHNPAGSRVSFRLAGDRPVPPG